MKKVLSLILVAQLQLTAGQVQQLQSLLAQMAALLVPAPPANTMTFVGNDLQAALNAAKGGDILVLAAGSVYTGDYVLPTKTGLVIVTSSAPPSAGLRVGPTTVGFARIVSSDGGAAIATSAGAGGGYTLIGLEIADGGAGGSDLVTLGDGSSAQTTLAQVPQNLTIDRCYLHGSPTNGRKRGIALNSGATTIEHSYLSDFKAIGQDAQAIAGWNGPGPYTITDNYIEGAANNLIFGGTDPAIPNLVPSDIMISWNTFAKPIAWRTGTHWLVKNLLELKNAQRVTSTHNTFSYSWADGQGGYALVFTVRNQDGHCPWCIVANVTSDHDHISHAAAVLQTLGSDDTPTKPSLRLTNIKITNLVADDIDRATWNNPQPGMNGAPGAQQWILVAGGLTGGVSGLELGHVTITGGHVNAFMSLDGTVAEGLNVHDSIVTEGDYGITGTNVGQGRIALNAFAPTAIFTNNAIQKVPTSDGSVRTIDYGPQVNVVYPIGQPVNASQATTDGKPIGAAAQ